MKTDRKQRILDATVRLLEDTDEIDSVTTRRIADEADVNPAMVNYYYGSKNQLMLEAVLSIVESTADRKIHVEVDTGNPRKELYDFLITISDQIIQFEKYTKAFIPDLLLKAEIDTPLYIVPLLQEYFGDRKTSNECRILAYEMISILQLVFYRSDDFLEYADVDVHDMNQRRLFISGLMDRYMGDSL